MQLRTVSCVAVTSLLIATLVLAPAASAQTVSPNSGRVSMMGATVGAIAGVGAVVLLAPLVAAVPIGATAATGVAWSALFTAEAAGGAVVGAALGYLAVRRPE